MLGSVDFTNHNLLSVNTIEINDPGPTEGLILTELGQRWSSHRSIINTDGYLR